MVRLLYTLVTVSLLLNLYAIWQLEQLHSTESRVLEGARGSESRAKHGNESAPPPAKPALASARELVDLLSTVRDLTGRVESLEKNANSLQADTG